MKILIDAINIREGGGLTYLSNFLKHINCKKNKNIQVTLYTSKSASLFLPKRQWINTVSQQIFDLPFPAMFLYQQLYLARIISKDNYDILFSPGGTIPFICKIPVVTMSQNLLPFENQEASLFGFLNVMYFKMILLRFIQGESFKKASGVIFLSKYAIKIIENSISRKIKTKALIPHGVDKNFFLPPKPQRNINKYSFNKPFKIIYTSVVMPYKHQLEVLDAVYSLRVKGYPLTITIIGKPWKKYYNKVYSFAKKIDPNAEYIKFINHIPNKKLPSVHNKFDAAIFASSCENLPIILLESMASGLPIVSSSLGPMKEILGSGGLYFNPYSSKSIQLALEKFLLSSSVRFKLASLSYKMAGEYSWPENSENTLQFFKKLINEKN